MLIAKSPKNPYVPPSSYELRDLKVALNRNDLRPATTEGMPQALVLAWLRQNLSDDQRAAVFSSAWDVCIARKKRKAARLAAKLVT